MTIDRAVIELPALPGLVARESAEPGTLRTLCELARRQKWNAAAVAVVIENLSGWDPKARDEKRQGLALLSLPSNVRSWGAIRQLVCLVAPRLKRSEAVKASPGLVSSYATALTVGHVEPTPEALQATLGTATGLLKVALGPERNRGLVTVVVGVLLVVVSRGAARNVGARRF